MTIKIGGLVAVEGVNKKLEKAGSDLMQKWVIHRVMSDYRERDQFTDIKMATSFREPHTTYRLIVRLFEDVKYAKGVPEVKLKYRPCDYLAFVDDRLVGVITDIKQDAISDFDMVKIQEQNGGTRYCYRYILEKLQA